MPSDTYKNLRVLSCLEKDYEGFRVSDDRVMHALWKAEEGHFWHRARNRFVAERLACLGVQPPAQVLDLGCGSGGMSTYLDNLGYAVTGVEGHLRLTQQAAARAPRANFIVHDLALGTGALAGQTFDMVGLFDVLEHLQDPAQMLREGLACVKTGGLLVGTVPALMSLWSQVDVQAGHRLRYDARSLYQLLRTLPDAIVIEVLSFNRILIPFLWAQRRFLNRMHKEETSTSEANLSVPPWLINRAFFGLVRVEHKLSALLNETALAGSSLWFAVRRLA